MGSAAAPRVSASASTPLLGEAVLPRPPGAVVVTAEDGEDARFTFDVSIAGTVPVGTDRGFLNATLARQVANHHLSCLRRNPKTRVPQAFPRADRANAGDRAFRHHLVK